MKKLLAVVLILVCVTGTASADTKAIGKDVGITYNSYAKTVGVEELDLEQIQVSENIAMLSGTGYEVMFFVTADDKIEKAGIRLIDESASGPFLQACSILISTLGDMDLKAFGYALYQYGLVRKGDPDTIPYYIGTDAFSMYPAESPYIIYFIYLNNDLKESI